MLISIDRYSRWPAACMCKASTGKTAKSFLEQYILLNGITQTIRTDKDTAFTGNKFRSVCKTLNIKLIYGTSYLHTATGLVERSIKILKDFMRTNRVDNCTVGEALSRSLTVMRTTVHSSIKETPFESDIAVRKKAKKGNNKLFTPTNGYKRNCFSTTGNPPCVLIQQRI